MDPLEIIKKVKEILELDKNTIVGIISGFILGIIPAFFIWRHYWRLDLFQRCKQYKSERDGLLQELLRETDKLDMEHDKNIKLQEECRDLQMKLSQLGQESHPPELKLPPADPIPPEATSLPLVAKRQEIEDNVKLFDKYLSGDSTEREFARYSLVRGKCFVLLREGGRSYFAPSKFVGYTNDNRAKYEAHVGYLDGRATNAAISSVLHHESTL